MAWIAVRVCKMTLKSTLFVVLMTSWIAHGSTVTNLLDNGSFESGSPDSLFEIPSAEDSAHHIPGWLIQKGSVDWARGRWKSRASDCSRTCIDLTGGEPGSVTTSFTTVGEKTEYTVLLDAAANPDDPVAPVIGNFSVRVLDSNNNTINSSVVNVNGDGYGVSNIGWRTSWLIFTTTSAGTLNLTLTSHIGGLYGPLIDNVRVYEGLAFPPASLELEATCRADLPTDHTSKAYRTSLIVGVVVPLISIIALSICVFLWRKSKTDDRQDRKGMPNLQIEGRLKILKYHVLKTATQNFNTDRKLGQGRFGAVFKGVLPDGTEVAVKQPFSKSHEGQQEFLNEVTLISLVQHRNLVALKGCCIEGVHRLLVYELVENTSLYQALLDPKHAIHLDWPTRLKIAIGTARGLAYLHEASQPRILHRDIKASNILLDKNFNAKIADFGLAKLFPDDQTHVTTRVAGTLGYVAPEYALKGLLTEKADVFSFGIVALELVSGRRNLDHTLLPEKEYDLLDWARQLHDEGRILHLIDPKLQADGYCEGEVVRVIKVGLLCTQAAAAMRPTMSHAMTLLLGEDGIPVLGSSEALASERPNVALLNSHHFSHSYCSTSSSVTSSTKDQSYLTNTGSSS